MKAGLVTFYHIHHYGALLQAAATERAVESLGGECEIIDYYVNQNNALFRRPTGVGSAAADAHTALHYSALKRRYDRFEQFSADHLHISAQHYENRWALAGASLPYDVLLSGSDQIWNPPFSRMGDLIPSFSEPFLPCAKLPMHRLSAFPIFPSGWKRSSNPI